MRKRILVVLSLILVFGLFAAAYAFNAKTSASEATINVKVEKSDETTKILFLINIPLKI